MVSLHGTLLKSGKTEKLQSTGQRLVQCDSTLPLIYGSCHNRFNNIILPYKHISLNENRKKTHWSSSLLTINNPTFNWETDVLNHVIEGCPVFISASLSFFFHANQFTYKSHSWKI